MLFDQPSTESQDRVAALVGIGFPWAPQGRQGRKPKVSKKRKR